ncbi:MAG: hypothetical protein AABX99_03070 [Nanoarchaeota archaeon]
MLDLFPTQIRIPDSFVQEGKYHINLSAFSEYLRKNYGLIKNYSFVSIIDNNESSQDQSQGYASPRSKSFIIINKSPTNNQIFEHEFLHLLGARDKDSSGYNYRGSNDIMKNIYFIDGHIEQEALQGYYLREKDFISEETAKEIGWMNQ